MINTRFAAVKRLDLSLLRLTCPVTSFLGNSVVRKWTINSFNPLCVCTNVNNADVNSVDIFCLNNHEEIGVVYIAFTWGYVWKTQCGFRQETPVSNRRVIYDNTLIGRACRQCSQADKSWSWCRGEEEVKGSRSRLWVANCVFKRLSEKRSPWMTADRLNQAQWWRKRGNCLSLSQQERRFGAWGWGGLGWGDRDKGEEGQ